MRKLLLLGSLLATMSGQAQEAETLSFYWPGERVTELQNGTQYFIYNTAQADGDRSYFLYSNGSDLRTTNVSPLTFITTENKYLFTTNKPENPKAPTHWYLNSVHGIVGHGGQTNNTEARDIYITRWYGNTENFTKSSAKSEDEQGVAQDPTSVDTKVWAVTQISGKNPNPGPTNPDNTYAWNGNIASDNAWTRWSEAHPYAFYTAKSAELNAEQTTCYREATNRNGIVGDMAFSLQQLFGLIKSGDQYYSNYPEDAPAENSSYAHLIDGNDNTYFHSSWDNNDITPETPNHYLRAELPEAKSSFYFINKRRTNTNNNRPTSILIEGCNEANGKYETITTISDLPTAENEYYYISEKIECSKAYKYIRFTSLATNTGYKYFNYSEFYVLDANGEIDQYISSMRDFYYTISRNPKDENFVSSFDYTKYQALTEAQENLSFNLHSTEANTLLTENQSNHADVPVLGQYPTVAYNALQTAVNTAQTSDELAAAIKTFKFSINAPVFTINGAYNGSYNTTGKSIYLTENTANPLRWDKATNKYDKTMLWKFAGSTSTTAEVGQTYTAMNMAEDVYFWNVEQLNVTETNPTNTDGIVLIKTVGNNSPVHAQNGGLVVRWDNSAPNSASGWTITYVGESFKIDQVNEEQLAAYAQLKTLVPECEPYSDFIGTGLGKFTCEGHDFDAALTVAKDIIAKDLYADPSLDAVAALKDLQAAKEALAINQPEPGKFYRIRGASGKYISSEAISTTVQGATIYKLKMTEATDKTTALFLSEGNRITTEKMQNMSRAGVHLQGLGGKYKFTAHQEIGKYVITPTESPTGQIGGTTDNPLYDYSAESGAVDQVSNANDANCAWTLEEVTATDQQPTFSRTINSDAGYATLGAPVALNIPDRVKAYTVTVNSNNTVATLNEVTGGIIPAGCGVVLEVGRGTYNFTFAAGADAIEGNRLVPLYTDTDLSTEINAYILADKESGLGFYQLDPSSRTIGANKAYLELPSTLNHVRSITIGGPTTGIEETVANGNEAEEYYDLQGRRVLNPTKGIYVTKSGKKIIINK